MIFLFLVKYLVKHNRKLYLKPRISHTQLPALHIQLLSIALIIILTLLTYYANAKSSIALLEVEEELFAPVFENYISMAFTDDIQNITLSKTARKLIFPNSNKSVLKITVAPTDALTVSEGIAKEENDVFSYLSFSENIQLSAVEVIPSLFIEKGPDLTIGGVDLTVVIRNSLRSLLTSTSLSQNHNTKLATFIKLENALTASSSYKVPFAFKVGMQFPYKTFRFKTGVGRDEDKSWYPIFSSVYSAKNYSIQMESLNKMFKTSISFKDYTFALLLTEEDVQFLLRKKGF